MLIDHRGDGSWRSPCIAQPTPYSPGSFVKIFTTTMCSPAGWVRIVFTLVIFGRGGPRRVAWRELPKAIRAGILAMGNAAIGRVKDETKQRTGTFSSEPLECRGSLARNWHYSPALSQPGLTVHSRWRDPAQG